jgi:hypothetical protein
MPADLCQKRGGGKTGYQRKLWVQWEISDEYLRSDFDGEGEDGVFVVVK